MGQPYPDLGQIFSLTLNGDATRISPVGFIETLYGRPSIGSVLDNWKVDGKQIAGGVQTRQFKLVSVGAVPNRPELITKLQTEGRIPAGQWIMAFMETFPVHDCKGHVGVADGWVRLEYPIPDPVKFTESRRAAGGDIGKIPPEPPSNPKEDIYFPTIYFPAFLIFEAADREDGFPAGFRWLVGA